MLWNDWYLNANPGPYYPCLPPASGEAANPTWSFDPTVAAGSASDAVKLTYKNNNAGLINLTPGTSYTCKTWAGELSWNATTHVLTVRGTMFIDGSAKIDNGLTNSYTGQGVIYMSGTLLIKNSKLCGQLEWQQLHDYRLEPEQHADHVRHERERFERSAGQPGLGGARGAAHQLARPVRDLLDVQHRGRDHLARRRAPRRRNGHPRPDVELRIPAVHDRPFRDAGQPSRLRGRRQPGDVQRLKRRAPRPIPEA